MRLFQKVLAGCFYVIGIPMLAIALSYLLNPNASKEDKEVGIAVATLFAGPPLIAAGLLTWNLRRTAAQTEDQQEQTLEQLFLKILQDSEGSITPLRFAAETGIPIAEAKTYLDEKAVELNATFEVSEAGSIVYRFQL